VRRAAGGRGGPPPPSPRPRPPPPASAPPAPSPRPSPRRRSPHPVAAPLIPSSPPPCRRRRRCSRLQVPPSPVIRQQRRQGETPGQRPSAISSTQATLCGHDWPPIPSSVATQPQRQERAGAAFRRLTRCACVTWTRQHDSST